MANSTGTTTLTTSFFKQIGIIDEFLKEFLSKSKCSNVWILENVDPNLDDIDLSDCNQECNDPMGPPVLRPSHFNADWSLPPIVVIINSMAIFEVIVHKFRVLEGVAGFCIFGFPFPSLFLSHLFNCSICSHEHHDLVGFFETMNV